MRPSDGFRQWLSACGGALAVTTYQAGKIAPPRLGRDVRAGDVAVATVPQAMGVAVRSDGAAGRVNRLALATRHEVLLLADAPLLAADYLESGSVRYDALYLPRAA